MILFGLQQEVQGSKELEKILLCCSNSGRKKQL
jgi:hypothetical protein